MYEYEAVDNVILSTKTIFSVLFICELCEIFVIVPKLKCNIRIKILVKLNISIIINQFIYLLYLHNTTTVSQTDINLFSILIYNDLLAQF